jgi:hypothetical protein
MAYVPGYKHDIFFSYAHDDNVRVPGRDPWITTFLDSVKGLLSSSFGQGGKQLDIFLDDRSFRANQQLPELLAAARSSAVFLCVCSPNYLASEWGREELAAFHQAAGETTRLFAVEKLPLDPGEVYPPPLDAHKRIELWSRPKMHGSDASSLFPPDQDWFHNVEGLANDIKKKLKSMFAEASGRAAPPPRPAPISMPAPLQQAPAQDTAWRPVLLAQTSEGLNRSRNELRFYFEQYGVPVLPSGVYPQGAADFAAAFAADLAHSEVFVQLLGESPGMQPPDLPQGYARYQFEAARNAGLKIIQWRNPELAMANVDDGGEARHLELVGGASVVADSFESFKKDLLLAVQRPPPPEPVVELEPGDPGRSVFVNAADEDHDIAVQIAKTFDIHRFMSVMLGRMPPSKEKEEAARKKRRAKLEQAVLDCDGLVVIYGEGDSSEAAGRSVMLFYNKNKHLRPDGPAKALGIVYVTPDYEEETGLFGLGQELIHIHAPAGVDAGTLNPIIDALTRRRELSR